MTITDEEAVRLGREAARRDLLDYYEKEREAQLEALRQGRWYADSPGWPTWAGFNDLFAIVTTAAKQAAKREFDAETRAYAARAKSLGLCKCEENPA